MKIGIKDGEIVLREAYSGVLMETNEGNAIGICMRDDTFEINVLPKDRTGHWHRVDMQKSKIVSMAANQSLEPTNKDSGGSV